MQTVLNSTAQTAASAVASRPMGEATGAASAMLANYQIIRRNGAVVAFEPNKIAVAMMKAFLAVHGTQASAKPWMRSHRR
jgi:ribonucleoside-diphosphate reductase alpha chain